MGKQPSSRRDQFGAEGIGEDDAADIGTAGHSSQGATASTHTGGTRGHDACAQMRTGSPTNEQGPGETRITGKD